MSPLDDELRAALHGRAQVLAPSPDPLAGIERRAKRIQRNRIGAAVAGSVLAVAAIAAVMPALQTATTSQRDVPRVAQSTAPDAPVSYALDPQQPWDYRGIALGQDFVDAMAREVATLHGRPADADRVIALFGQTYEPSGRTEAVFVWTGPNGSATWGVARSAESGPEVVQETDLAPGTTALVAALSGDDGTRLLAVAAPGTTLEYGHNDASEFDPMTALEPGVATTPLDGDPATDVLRVLDRDGTEIFRGPAPDAEQTADPENVLSEWPTRGGPVDAELEARLAELFRQGLGEPTAEVAYRALFRGDTDGGVRYTIGQAWVIGQEAHTVALTQGGTQGEQFLLGPKTDPDAQVVAALLCCQPGSAVDTLVVIPVPGTGQVLYAPGRDGEPEPVGAGQDYLDGVVLVDRDPRADGDRLRLLDGDGDLDNPLFDGAVFDLLCGLKGCG